MRNSLQYYIRRQLSSDTGSHISKDMKGNAETKIKKWLNDNTQKIVTPNNGPKTPTNSNNFVQKPQKNDMCIIL